MPFKQVDTITRPRAGSSESYERRFVQANNCADGLESNRRASRILDRRRASMTSHPSRLAFVVATVLAMAAVRAGAQETPRQLFEAGKYQAAIDKSAGDGSPATLYLKGLSYVKLNQPAE